MSFQEQEIWQTLLHAHNWPGNRSGSLLWNRVIGVNIPMDDPRAIPARFLGMTGGLRSLEEHHPEFGTGDLRRLDHRTYLAPDGEITGTNGALRLLSLFPRIQPPPQEILLVGAITPNSLLSVLKYCQLRKWPSAVTLVDSSPIPIRVIEEMVKHGLIDWPNLSLVQSDIINHSPQHPPDLIIGDMLCLWMNDNSSTDAHKYWPSEKYNKYLKWVASNLSKGGHFLSRVVLPLETNPNQSKLNRRFSYDPSKTAASVLHRIGPELRGAVDVSNLRGDLETLFDGNIPIEAHLCGRYQNTPPKGPLSARVIPHIVRKYRDLHRESFNQCYEIDVEDRVCGAQYLTFLCGS